MLLGWLQRDSESVNIGFKIYLSGIRRLFEYPSITAWNGYWVGEAKIIKMYCSLMASEPSRLDEIILKKNKKYENTALNLVENTTEPPIKVKFVFLLEKKENIQQ